jgi:hypothetical protein
MNKIIERFYSLLKVQSGFLIVFFVGLLTGIVADWLSKEYGFFRGMTLVVIAFVIFFIIASVLAIIVATIFSLYKGWKRKQLKNVSFEPLDETYKGLIVSISMINVAKEEIINKINSVKDINNLEDLKKLFELRGVGQTFRAIIHHRKELEVCWLLHTEGSMEAEEVVEHFINKFCLKLIDTIPIRIEDPYNLKNIHKAVDEIYVKRLEEANLHETDVIADITGGTTPMSSAIILACTSSDRKLEYVEQDTNQLKKSSTFELQGSLKVELISRLKLSRKSVQSCGYNIMIHTYINHYCKRNKGVKRPYVEAFHIGILDRRRLVYRETERSSRRF